MVQRADASLSHVKLLRVRADVIALAPASFRVGGAVECDLYVTLIRGNSRTEKLMVWYRIIVETSGLRRYLLQTAFIRQGQRSS